MDKCSPFKARNGSEYSFACFTHCQEFLHHPNFWLPGLFTFFFSKLYPYFLNCVSFGWHSYIWEVVYHNSKADICHVLMIVQILSPQFSAYCFGVFCRECAILLSEMLILRSACYWPFLTWFHLLLTVMFKTMVWLFTCGLVVCLLNWREKSLICVIVLRWSYWSWLEDKTQRWSYWSWLEDKTQELTD